MILNCINTIYLYKELIENMFLISETSIWINTELFWKINYISVTMLHTNLLIRMYLYLLI